MKCLDRVDNGRVWGHKGRKGPCKIERNGLQEEEKREKERIPPFLFEELSRKTPSCTFVPILAQRVAGCLAIDQQNHVIPEVSI